MRLAVISDTHMGTVPHGLDRVYSTWLEPADALVHCGDITGAEVWSYFLQHPDFHCVRGNCDWDPQLTEALEPMARFELDGLNIGLTHGWGPRSQVPVKVAQAFGPGFDLVCFGHTHQPTWTVIDGVQLCNPGSLGESGTLAVVTIGPGGSLDCEFIRI